MPWPIDGNLSFDQLAHLQAKPDRSRRRSSRSPLVLSRSVIGTIAWLLVGVGVVLLISVITLIQVISFTDSFRFSSDNFPVFILTIFVSAFDHCRDLQDKVIHRASL